MTDDNNNVVKLRQPPSTQTAAVAVGASDPIQPKSLINMTDAEQDMFLQHLRERRLRVVELLRAASAAKKEATTVAALVKLEKKQVQVTKQLDKATASLERLEELIYDMRALALQYTDIDITKVKE